jgi:glutathione S-transferase
VNEANWRVFRGVVLGGLSAPLRRVRGPIARREVRKQLEGHGVGKHSTEEVAAIGQRDIAALAAILGPKPWFFGGEATSTDAVVHAQLINIWRAPMESEVKRPIGEKPNLVAFLDRFAAHFYS